MSLLALLGSRTRSKQNASLLILQTQNSNVGTTTVTSPSSPRARNRLRKRPTLGKTLTKAASPPKTPPSSCSRGTLGGFCIVDDLERQQSPNPEEKLSVIKNVGRKIGLGLRLQGDSSNDLSLIADGTESWYLSYPPPTPTFPDTGVEYLDDEPEVASDSHSEAEDDHSSVTSDTSAYPSSISSIFTQNVPDGPDGVGTLILSAQTLADQYRNLFSPAPTPGPYPLQVSATPQWFDVLAPLPLQITQNRKPKRPSRRLSQRNPPNIPPRQHFKLAPQPKTLRKVQARHSLHKYIDIKEYEHILKSSRLSECSTLVSSKENTPLPTPRADGKDIEAFPQTWVVDLERGTTPEVPPRNQKRRAPTVTDENGDGDHRRVPLAGYDRTDSEQKRKGGVEWEVWI